MNAKELLLKMQAKGYSKSTMQKAFHGYLQSVWKIDETARLIDQTNSEAEFLKELDRIHII